MADIASLVIGLRADVAQLQNDLGRANALNRQYAKSAADEWNKAADSFRDSMVAFAKGFVGAISTDKIIDLGKRAIDTADQFNKMSQKVGISVESLSSLNSQARLSDVAIDGLQGGLAKLARNAADGAAGSKAQAAAFQAMGVSLKDANGNLRSTEDILGDVAAKFSNYEDSAAKTALAQKLFGKSGADLIPLLNQLGEQGFKKAREEAEKYGQVISGSTAAQAEEFNDNLTRLTMAASGFANAVVREVLPDLVEMSAKFADASTTSDGYTSSAEGVATAVKEIAHDVADLTAVLSSLPGEVQDAAVAFDQWASDIAGTNSELRDMLDLLPKVRSQQGSGLFQFPTGDDGLLPGVAQARDFISWLTSPTLGSGLADKIEKSVTAPLNDLDTSLKIVVGDVTGAQVSFDGLAHHVESTGTAARKTQAPIVGLGDAAKKATRDHVQFSEALKQAAGAMERILGLSAGYQSEIDAIVLRMGGADDAQVAYAKALNDINAAYKSLLELGPPTADAVEAVGLATQKAGERMNLTRTFDAQREAMQKYQEELQKTKDMWGSFADAVFDAVTKSGNFLKNLLANLKQVVEQMLREWFRTSVIGLFTGGGGGAGYGGLVSAGIGLVSAGGGGAGDFNMGGPSGTTAAGNAGLFGTATQGFSLFTAGKTMWNGFSTGLSNFWNGTGGAGYSGSFNMGGSSGVGYNGAYGGYGSGFGQALGIGGALYAGYSRYQQGGALGGAAGGITYGLGTYAAGAGIASAAAGTGFAAGVSGAFSAIPIVGWIALAAMVVDMISGGKLFGTDANKLAGGGETIGISGSGADVTSHYTLKGQKPLFGGSYYEEHAYTDQDAIDAANQFFAQLKSGTEDFAKQFGVTMGDIVGGTFATTFDKHGNITSSSSTVNGVTYDNDTVQQFQERIVAENELAVLGQFDEKLSDAIDKYRKNADDLYAITNDLAAAQMGFNQGLTFLALGSDQSTSALLHLAETSQHFGETVDQTLQRLMAAQAQYDQFVGQFKPATNYVDDFEATLSQINQQMQANVKQANALAQAAGAAGASEQDLANIHKYAAEQAQQAFRALQASAQSLAFGLGLTTAGSLDQVNAEIERLQAKANAGAGAVNNFGQAMQTAAENAKHAMDLLLGDLSPLNDQQKLQQALSGLRAGTVTQDQVLEIGRRLYSSTAQYTALFNMVQAMGSGAATSLGGAGFSGGNAGGLSAAESHRLQDLLKQQQQLQAAAQLQQYQTLAQQIAEISAFKGEDWHQVAKEMGIDIAAFEKGLGLTEKQTDDYITAIEKQTDDNGENTASIVAILTKIYDVLSGTDPSADPDAPNGRTPGRGGGHSGHGGRGRYFSDEDADAFGRAVGRHSGHAGNPRSSRPPTAAATTR